jgi:hypothetical protein
VSLEEAPAEVSLAVAPRITASDAVELLVSESLAVE